ncbi:MAG: phage portal protein [Dysgonomonas sp.]
MPSITTDQISGTRERFYRTLPNRGFGNVNPFRHEVFQSDFLAQLDTAGHNINDPSYYENIYKKVPRNDAKGNEIKGEFDYTEEELERVSIPMQSIILSKHLTHLGGENIKFVQHNINPSDKERETFVNFKQGWFKKNMETAKFEFMKSVKATGDGAFCAVMTNGKFSYRVYSVLNGDRLHPIRDFHGNLRVFGRSFSQYDYGRQEEVPYMAVWDDKYYTLLSYDTEMKSDAEYIVWDSETFKPRAARDDEFDGWRVVESPIEHGFNSIPIVYLKDEKGACWSPVQHLIDKLEMALSQLFENNKSYAFRIMVVKGGVNIVGDLKGHARAMAFKDKDGDAKFMEKADASSSFDLQLNNTLRFIELGSFIVLPPEKLNGDLPGVTIKILYSPAIEQGLNDKHFYNASIDKIVELFKHGYGIEQGKPSDYTKLDIRGDIQIYIHQNDSETMQNLTLGVQAGFTSRETASETSPYSAADELSRLDKQKEKDMEDEIKSERTKLVGNSTNSNGFSDGMNETNLERQLTAQ